VELQDAETPGRGGSDSKVEALRADATRLRRAGDQQGAVQLLTHALDLADERDERRDVLVDLAAAEARTHTERAITHYHHALALFGRGEERLITRIRLARCLAAAGRVEDALAEIETAVADASTAEQRLRCDLVFVSLARQTLATRPLGRDRLDRLAGEASQPRTAAERAVLGELAYEGALAGAAAERVAADARAALGGDSLSGLHDLAPLTRQVVMLTLCWCDDLRTAERAAQLLLARSERRGISVDAAAANQIIARAALHRGALDAAAAAADEVLAASNAGFVALLPSASGLKAMALAASGAVDAARSALELPGGHEPWADTASYHGYLVGQARVLIDAGDPEGAYRAAVRCGTLANQMGTVNPAVLEWRSLAAHAAADLGMLDEAAVLAEDELELARRFGAPSPIAGALSAVARSRNSGDAIALLDEAGALVASTPARLGAARVALELAERLRDDDRTDEAVAAARSASGAARELGAGVLLPRATSLLAELTARPALGHRARPSRASARPAGLEIHALGGFRVVGPDAQDVTPAGIAGKAVRVLIASERPLHVEELAELLWEDGASPDRARARLRNVVARARTSLGPLVVRDGDLLLLDPAISVDADRFENAARAALATTTDDHALEHTVAASLQYAGDLLPGDPYADWAVFRREQLRTRYLALCDRGADLAVAAGLTDLAVDLLEAAMRHDRYDDQRADRAAEILTAAGRDAAARAMSGRAAKVRRALGI
jgi:DNA-binding SARP family transcriptional activator